MCITFLKFHIRKNVNILYLENNEADHIRCLLIFHDAQTGYQSLHYLDAEQAKEAFFDGTAPHKVNGKAIVLDTPNSKLRSSGNFGSDITMDELRTCEEVDVILTGKDKCYVLINTDLLFPNQGIHRFVSSNQSTSPVR